MPYGSSLLMGKIRSAVQRFSEIAVQGLRLGTRPSVDKSKSNGAGAFGAGTFFAMKAIEKYLGDVSTDTIDSLVEKNVDVDIVWETIISPEFKEYMIMAAYQCPKQLRYVLTSARVIEAIQYSNPSLSEYFADYALGRVWLDSILSGLRSKLGV